jgi:exosome complex component RRP4
MALTGRGHGTYVESEQVVSSVTGTIERVNKLISVRALKSRWVTFIRRVLQETNDRYIPEVGDLVIGRIVEVGSSRWKVDANARQDAVLMLSSVNLPGGVQVCCPLSSFLQRFADDRGGRLSRML